MFSVYRDVVTCSNPIKYGLWEEYYLVVLGKYRIKLISILLR
jgi:hypothetical protein